MVSMAGQADGGRRSCVIPRAYVTTSR